MDFSEALKRLPQSPGIYQMKDALGNVIYVGKAKNLKNRVSQYFHTQKDRSPKIVEMVQNIRSFEYTAMDTELDAFIEECRLIKEMKPRYNRQMKNDRNYTYIRIPDEDYPKIIVVKEKADDNALYFGPFNSQFRVECAVRYLNDFYPVRKCAGPGFTKKANGCLYHQLGTCSGACTGKITPEEYKVHIHKINQLLNGNDMPAIQGLLKKIDTASEQLEFEEAAKYTQYYLGLRHVIGKQRLVLSSGKNRNILAAEYIDPTRFKLFLIKGNKLLYRQLYDLNGIGSPAFIPELKMNLLEKLAAPQNIQNRLTQQDIDEAQIIYGYLKKHREHILNFWIPSSWLDKESAVLDSKISSILNRIRLASSFPENSVL